MIRVNYHLTEGQLAELRRMAEETGLSVAELIRRAVDEMIRREKRKKAKED